jgi:ribose transport system ATP-binding protein
VFLLEANGITKSFGPTQVLRGVDFAVAPGEIHALLGGNGAGKSTLLKIVSGVLARDGGMLLYNGHSIESREGREAWSGGIAVVHQELAVLPHLTVAENIELPHHRQGWSLFSQRSAYDAALKSLALIDPEFAERAAPMQIGDLTLHEQQLVEIARALKSGAQLLLLDEPTANLTAGETEKLFDVLRRLTMESQISVVFVSHRMREIRQIAHVCTIIRDGLTAVNRRSLESLTDAEIVEFMGQAPHLETPTARPVNRSVGVSLARQGGGTIEIMGRGIDLSRELGSVIGLAGAPTGPQRLIDALTGVNPDPELRIVVDGREKYYRSPREAARHHVGFVSGDRANKGVLATLPIIDNMMASSRIARRKALVPFSETADAERLVNKLRIKARSVWDLPSTLSGGTQQKLLIARWLELKPEILVLEEPTRGVDIGTKRDIYDLIRAMAAEGTTVIWWSTEQSELIELCDAVLSFEPDGRPTGVLKGDELNEERLAKATGMAA